MNINDLIPGLEEFKTILDTKPKVQMPGHEEEAWRLGDYIPDTWVEDGVRHITIFGGDLLPERLSLEKSNNRWVVKKEPVF